MMFDDKNPFPKLTLEELLGLGIGTWQPSAKFPFFICAPNHRQFVNYLRKHEIPTSDAIYIDSENKAAGLVGVEVILVGHPSNYSWGQERTLQWLLELEKRGDITLTWDEDEHLQP